MQTIIQKIYDPAQTPVILAPMAGITDVAMRTLAIESGADVAFAEMVSAKGLAFANEKTRHLLDPAPNESQLGVQLFGHEPQTLASQAAWVTQTLGPRLAYIDINMGCPAKKIAGKGDGAALMTNPALAAQIIKAVKSATTAKVAAKFRRGFCEGEETAPELAKALEEAGADILCVHGRYARQMYRGHADWGVVKRTKESVKIPVIGNGDIKSGPDAAAMRAQTGCDAVMIARAAEGNPWIFAQVKAALAGEPAPQLPSVKDKLNMARRHARLLAQTGDHAIVRMRKHAMFYIAGLPGAAAARSELTACNTLNDFEKTLTALEAKIINK